MAQTFYGGVRGAVRDATGVVPGVTLTLTNEHTNVVSSTVTNEAGQYVFPNTPPGLYTLASTLAGFKTFERRGLTIGTQQILVIDVTHAAGAERTDRQCEMTRSGEVSDGAIEVDQCS